MRLALIRRPETGQEHEPTMRRWYAASTHPDRTWLATGLVEYPTDLLRIDFEALDAGSTTSVEALDHVFLDEPLLGVCTNGKRDQCCATLGRKVAIATDVTDAVDQAAGTADTPPAVWEITHVGGHKFAPTGVLLPAGYVYGRLDAALTVRILADARREMVVLDGCRGRSTWSRPGQAAELAMRVEIGERGLTCVRVTSVEQSAPDPTPAWRVMVEHDDGRAFEVEVAGEYAAVPRPESCGKADGTPLELRITGIDKIR